MVQYAVVFGNEQHHPESNFGKAKKFKTLAKARRYSEQYKNGHVVKKFDNGCYEIDRGY